MLKVYENIRKRRLELGLSQQKLAEMTGYTDKSAIAHIEKGERDIAHSKLELFAKALRTTPWDLLGSTEDSETILLDLFSKLNKEGQEKVLDYVSDLVASRRYVLQYSESQVV